MQENLDWISSDNYVVGEDQNTFVDHDSKEGITIHEKIGRVNQVEDELQGDEVDNHPQLGRGVVTKFNIMKNTLEETEEYQLQ